MSPHAHPDFGALDAAIAARWHSPEHDSRFRRLRRTAYARAAFEGQGDVHSHVFDRYLKQPDARPRKRRGNPNFAMPRFKDFKQEFRFSREWGASEEQVRQARALAGFGLKGMAKRVSLCGTLGRRVNCTGCGERFFIRFGCNTRYCPRCGQRIGRKLFSEAMEKLSPVAERIVQQHQRAGRTVVIAKLDFTVPKRPDGKMPTPGEVKKFHKDLWRFRRAMERRFDLTRDDYGAIGIDEFGGSNTNLHRHCVYVGPWLPQKKRELSNLWSEIRGEESHVSIKRARTFAAGLAHALHYPMKFLSGSNPERLAALEAAFAGTRRLAGWGLFYNAKVPAREPGADELLEGGCPYCQSPLAEPAAGFSGGWVTASALEAEGRKDLGAIRDSVKVRFTDFERRAGFSPTGVSPP